MFVPSITVKVHYDMNNINACFIQTNAKPEAVEEVLSAWVRNQIGKGKDEREPAMKEIYEIVIEIDLSNDSFRTTADTGNDSLTLGIISRMILPSLSELRCIAQAS
ncbi:MAG TPA: hypothetical protein VJ579_03010 [Candidatus Paceibacterota bacterium]|nr:hypothetical protein [Candidatus Paceibacterota bacterium]